MLIRSEAVGPVATTPRSRLERLISKRALLTGALAIIVLCAQISLTGANAQKKPHQNPDAYIPQIMALLQKHDDALNRHDLDGVAEVFVPGERTVVLGTGPNERWQGQEQIRAAYAQSFKDFDEGTMTRQCYWKTGGISGDLGWVAAACRFSDSKQGRARQYEVNITGVLEKQQGRWYFTSLHTSNANKR